MLQNGKLQEAVDKIGAMEKQTRNVSPLPLISIDRGEDGEQS